MIKFPWFTKEREAGNGNGFFVGGCDIDTPNRLATFLWILRNLDHYMQDGLIEIATAAADIIEKQKARIEQLEAEVQGE